MTEWFWLRAYPSGYVHLWPGSKTEDDPPGPICGNSTSWFTPDFPPGAARCPKCFTIAGLPLTYEAEQRMLYGLRAMNGDAP